MRLKLFMLPAILMSLISSQALAFKLRTHAFLGQELINDLRVCWLQQSKPCVYIINAKDEKIPVNVPENVARSILDNPQSYLVGTFGPDAFSDILSGQMIIHPGFDDKANLGTGDWVRKLTRQAQSSQEIAFSYGFAGHAAADTFAHTYVNTYAGDVFALGDGETDVEQRHMMLESLIDHKTPNLRSHMGEELGNVYDYLGGQNLKQVPLDFIVRSMIHDSESSAMNARSPSGAHLNLLKNLHEEIGRSLFRKDFGPINWNDLAKRLLTQEELAQSGSEFIRKTLKELEGAGTIQKIEVVVMKYIAFQYSKTYLTAAEADRLAQFSNEMQDWAAKNAGELLKIKQRINQKVSEFEKYQDSGVSTVAGFTLDTLVKLNSELNKYAQYYIDYENAKVAAARKLIEKQEQLGKQLCTEINNICPDLPIIRFVPTTITYECELTRKVTKQVDDTCERTESGSTRECKKVFGEKICWDNPFKQVVKFACKVPQVVDEVYKSTCERIETQQLTDYIEDTACKAVRESCRLQVQTITGQQQLAVSAYDAAVRLEQQALNTLTQQEEAVKKARDSLKSALDQTLALKQKWNSSLRNLEDVVIVNNIRVMGDLRRLVEAWQQDVYSATKDWVQANGQAMLNSTYYVDTIQRPKISEPLKRWMACRLPVLGGVPLTNWDTAVCGPLDAVTKVRTEIERIEINILKEIARIDSDGLAGEIANQMLEFKKNGPVIVAESLHRAFERVGNDPFGDIGLLGHAFHGIDPDDHRAINKQFSVDNSRKNLVTFENEEFTKRIFFDMGFPNGEEESYFEVDRFSAARNAVNLMKLALADTAALDALFQKLGGEGSPHLSMGLSDVLSPWLRSIDGNHQWMEVAPPYPRKNTAIEATWIGSYCDPKNLARRFKKQAVGTEVFPLGNKDVFGNLFVGPLAPALETQNGSFGNKIQTGYPYLPNLTDPFPDLSIDSSFLQTHCGFTTDAGHSQEEVDPNQEGAQLKGNLVSSLSNEVLRFSDNFVNVTAKIANEKLVVSIIRRMETIEYRLHLDTLEIEVSRNRYMSAPELQKAGRSEDSYKTLAQEMKSAASYFTASGQQNKDLGAYLNFVL